MSEYPILCCDVSCYYSKKNFFRDSDRSCTNQLVQNCKLAIYVHYENTPMQHTVIFHARKNDNFHLKMFDYFLILAQNIDCGYTLEPPQ